MIEIMLFAVKYAGFILIALAFIGFALYILAARLRRRAEIQAEIRKAQEKEARERAKIERMQKAAAEKEEADRERKAEAARKKAEQAAEKEKVRAEKQAAREKAEKAAADKRTAKIEAARILAEYQERALSAARELKALKDAAEQVRPSAAPEQTQRPEIISDPAPAANADPAPENVPQPFAGQVVSFTGKLRNMSRAQAADLIRKGGGVANEKTMPVGTTLLVVGEIAGDGNTGKLDKADEWIGQVKKIYEPQFMAMLAG